MSSLLDLGEAMKCLPASRQLAHDDYEHRYHELSAEDVEVCQATATAAIASCEICGEWVYVPPRSNAPEIIVHGLEVKMKMVEQ